MRKAIRRDDDAVDNEVWGLLPEEFTGRRDRTELIGEATRVAAAPRRPGAGGRERRLLPLPRLLRRRGRQPHAADGDDGDDGSRCRCWSARSTTPGCGDAISPYGYPGAAILERPRRAARSRGARLVRDRAGQHLRPRPARPEPCLRGRHEALGGPGPRPGARAAAPRARSPSRSAATSGSATTSRSCPARRRRSSSGRASTHAYTETMQRRRGRGALLLRAGLLQDDPRLRALVAGPCAQPGRRAAAGAIVALSDGMLHYYLGGTRRRRTCDARRSRTSSTR